MLWLFTILFGCGTDPDPVEQRDERPTCGGGEEITLALMGYDDASYSFSWAIDEEFLADGGSFENADASEVVVQCPPCDAAELEDQYSVSVVITDADDHQEWVYLAISYTCE